MSDLEFLLGLLESEEPTCVAWEDFHGAHGKALWLWQDMGFLDREPGMNPVPSCPYCDDGAPYLLGERCLCNRCFSTVDRRHLCLWRLHLEAFLEWLAGELHLRGDVRQIVDGMWQLGTGKDRDTVYECFYKRQSPLSAAGTNKLAAYRNAVLLYGLSRPQDAMLAHATAVSLLAILRLGKALTVPDRTQLLRDRGDVRFDPRSGTLMVGDVWQGEVPVGSKEFFFLLCLSEQRDQFVAYEDIKHFVLQHTDSSDTTEEATFCHRLKNRIKQKGLVPTIDLLLATTNKGDGYRLRGYVGGLAEA